MLQNRGEQCALGLAAIPGGLQEGEKLPGSDPGE